MWSHEHSDALPDQRGRGGACRFHVFGRIRIEVGGWKRLGHQQMVPVHVTMMGIAHVRGGLLLVGQTMRSCVRNSALAVAMLLAISCGERQEVLYPDRAAAQQAGAIDRGWVPVWVPKSARAIHEIHDLDTNRSMMSFSFDAGEPLNLGSACTQVQRDALRPVPFAKTWWPNDVPPTQSVSHRHVYYACQDGAYVAVSPRDGEAHYWRP